MISRYQEDYVLAKIQKNVDKYSKNAYTLWNKKDQILRRNMYIQYFIIIVFILSILYIFVNKYL